MRKLYIGNKNYSSWSMRPWVLLTQAGIPFEEVLLRFVCAEMHSGFGALRSACPMNIEASLPDVGTLALRDKPGVRADLDRLVAMWSELLAQHGGPMLFGQFSIADAYFAPVVMRMRTYALPVPAPVTAYIERVCALPGVKAWIDGALAEKDFLDFEEPYRLAPDLSQVDGKKKLP